MPRGVILVDYTDQGRRTIKDSPDRAEAAKAEAAKLGVQVKDIFYTPGGPHDAAIIVEAHVQHPVVRQRENEIYPGFLDRGDAQDGLVAN
jgi:uncharacterized protein with GYD domain